MSRLGLSLPYSSNKNQLQCLKSTMPAQLVRKTLTEIIHGKRPSPVIHTGRYLKEVEILKLFKQPILVHGVTYAEHDLYNVFFIFKGFPKHEFFAVIGFMDDKDFHDVAAIVDAGPEKESAELRKRLQRPEYATYWLP